MALMLELACSVPARVRVRVRVRVRMHMVLLREKFKCSHSSACGTWSIQC